MKTCWVVFAIAVARGILRGHRFWILGTLPPGRPGPSPVHAERMPTEHGRPFHGLGIAYVVGRYSVVLGAAVAMGAIIGLLTFPLFISGIALIGIAVERLEAATLVRWKLLVPCSVLRSVRDNAAGCPLERDCEQIASRCDEPVMDRTSRARRGLGRLAVLHLRGAGLAGDRPATSPLPLAEPDAMYPTITALSWGLRPFLPQSL